MGTDWFVEVKCPRPNKRVTNAEEHVAACSNCPYATWEKPVSVAGFMASMCGVRVGSIGMAAELDNAAEHLLGIGRFTKAAESAAFKLRVLKQIKTYAQSSGWSISGLTLGETLKHLDTLIEFCQRAKRKGLDIWVWA
jgi:hypothetical protein